jgi:hypothetical protein
MRTDLANIKWNCIAADDFDKDGVVDFLVGNYGLNNRFRVSTKHLCSLTFKDFNADRLIDQSGRPYFFSKLFCTAKFISALIIFNCQLPFCQLSLDLELAYCPLLTAYFKNSNCS